MGETQLVYQLNNKRRKWCHSTIRVCRSSVVPQLYWTALSRRIGFSLLILLEIEINWPCLAIMMQTITLQEQLTQFLFGNQIVQTACQIGHHSAASPSTCVHKFSARFAKGSAYNGFSQLRNLSFCKEKTCDTWRILFEKCVFRILILLQPLSDFHAPMKYSQYPHIGRRDLIDKNYIKTTYIFFLFFTR